MPGLLDLPAELIEQIYHSYEDRIPVDEHKNSESGRYIYNKFEGRSFRLVNRYIQRAPHHSFASAHFQERRIREPDNRSIEMFCAMTSVPDSAQCVKQMGLCVDEDRLMRFDSMSFNSQSADVIGLGNKAMRIFDDKFGADVPLVYFQNKEHLI